MQPARLTYFRRIAAGGAVLAAAWCFHSQWTAPLRRCELEQTQGLADVRQRIADARTEIREALNQEQEQGKMNARMELNSLRGGQPGEPAVVWLPARLRSDLARFGIQGAAVRQNSAVPEPGLHGYERTYWRLTLPPQGGARTMTGILLAVADIERADRGLKVLDFSFQCDAAEPHWPAGGFNISALVRK